MRSGSHQSEHLWKWIDLHGKEFGIGRPYLDKDPAHVAPIDRKEYADHRRGANTQHARSETKTRVFYSLFATVIILRNSQKPRDRRIFDRLDIEQQAIHRGEGTLRGGRRCDARGDRRTGGTDRRRRGGSGWQSHGPTTEATAPREAGGPIMAIVSIMSQQVTFYDADGWILRAPLSTVPPTGSQEPTS